MDAKPGSWGFIWRFANRGTQAEDSDKERIRKAVVTLVTTTISGLAVIWGSIYLAIGYPWAGSIPFIYAVISFFSILYFFRTRHFRFFLLSQLTLIFVLPFLLQWSLGGFANGSVVLIWSFFTPLAALLFAQPQHASKWLLAFVGGTTLSAVLMLYPVHEVAAMPPLLNTFFFTMNICCSSILVYLLVSAVLGDREHTLTEIDHTKSLLELANARLKENEIIIRQLMMTDTLTGIPNRRFLDSQMAHELERHKRSGGSLTIAMTDIDFFKEINDEYGHTVGDHILVGFAQILKRKQRASDLVARFGGEEFVILLPGTTAEGAMEFANRVRAELKQQPIPPLSRSITTSFGITRALAEDTAESLLERVDSALYQSKREGRDRTTVI